jgi:hypothetical protein
MVEKFKTELKYTYYELAASKEEENAKEERLSMFMTRAYTLFKLYTKYYAELPTWARLVAPFDISATMFLSISMKGYLKQNGFFGNTSYLEVELQEALDALTAHVPGTKGLDTPLTLADPKNEGHR